MSLSAQLPLYLEFFDYLTNPVTNFLMADNIALCLFLMTNFFVIALLVTVIMRQKKQTRFSNSVVTAIAGDNVVATQLDLAKAYIEMNQKNLAKQMLKDVAKQGSKPQKREARLLMKAL